jgi:HSP20 family protein
MSMPERRGRTTFRRWDPFRELEDIRGRMSRLLERSIAGLPESGGAGWSPLVDVEETDSAYIFGADLPGVKREDVRVEVDATELRISGEVRAREREGVVRRQARMSGRYEYRSALPPEVDADRIEASLDDGVLTVRVPKTERSERRRVEISGGDPST